MVRIFLFYNHRPYPQINLYLSQHGRRLCYFFCNNSTKISLNICSFLQNLRIYVIYMQKALTLLRTSVILLYIKVLEKGYRENTTQKQGCFRVKILIIVADIVYHIYVTLSILSQKKY